MQRTVLVVGAAGGVGGALVCRLLERGYRVVGTVLDESERAAVSAACPEVSDLETMDLSSADSIRDILGGLLGRSAPGLHAAVVCAAVSPPGPLEIMHLEDFRRALEINVVSNLAIYQSCLPALRKTQGRLVLISSSAGRVAYPFLGAYVSTKHALEGLGDVMRQEAGRWGIEVILMEPGGIRTGMVRGTLARIERDQGALSPVHRELYGKQFQSFARVAGGALSAGLEPREVAGSIVDALETPAPQSRYVLGSDAQELFRHRRVLSDRDMDAMFAKVYES